MEQVSFLGIFLLVALVMLYILFNIALVVYGFDRKQYIFSEVYSSTVHYNLFGKICTMVVSILFTLPSQVAIFVLLAFYYIVEFICFAFFYVASATREDGIKWYKDKRKDRKWFFLF